MIKNGNNTLNWRVTQLERNYSEIDGKVEKILVNHLPHIQEQLSSLKTRINVLTLVNVGAIVLGILFSKYL